MYIKTKCIVCPIQIFITYVKILQTLHPLLEDGCEGDEEPEPYKKVAFIGISNWALDPAKMNRGIMVQRGVPDEQELINSAK